MLFTTHSIVGAAVGAATGNPVAGFFAGAASHHVLDSIIHFDQGSFRTEKSGAEYLGAETVYFENARWAFNNRDWIMLLIDMLLALVIFLIIFYYLPMSRWFLAAIGGLGGLAPDILDSSPLWSRKIREKIGLVKTYHRFHSYFHWTAAKKEIWIGALTQMILITAAILYLLH